MSCKEAQQRCWIAPKQLVSDVIMSDVMSIMENASSVELRGSEVVPVESRVIRQRGEHAMSGVLSGLVTRRLSLAV